MPSKKKDDGGIVKGNGGGRGRIRLPEKYFIPPLLKARVKVKKEDVNHL